MIDREYGPNTDAIKRVLDAVRGWTPEQVEAVRVAMAAYTPEQVEVLDAAHCAAWYEAWDAGTGRVALYATWRADTGCARDATRYAVIAEMAGDKITSDQRATLMSLFNIGQKAGGDSMTDTADLKEAAERLADVLLTTDEIWLSAENDEANLAWVMVGKALTIVRRSNDSPEAMTTISNRIKEYTTLVGASIALYKQALDQ